ncbi:MAG: cytoplasmic tRNA 2-thiolation protein 2 [Pleopsidium flavum]|nr:MAG: cytoplasmic tRNA 2-thiolation protein 2 [Pleopsidium flavum]
MHIEGFKGEEGVVCARCQISAATVLVRTDHLCRDCFMKYVGRKAVKRMESYQVRSYSKNIQRTLLLPVSCGVSSVTLLHILDQQLQSQLDRTGRAGYSLHVLLVDTSAEDTGVPTIEHLDELENKYPRPTYSTLTLSEISDYGIALPEDLAHGFITDEGNTSSSLQTSQARLHKFMSSLPSATSKADVLGILRMRLIVEFAKNKGCESILWGDSTTRLAEKTLAETAKGRGFSLPWQTSEGESPHGIHFKYPLRDLLKKELSTYSSLTSPPLTPLIVGQSSSRPISASAKSTTIDDLMSQYFESVETNYPSIVANVVRTSSKLSAPQFEPKDQNCKLCGLPIADGSGGMHGWGGDQQKEIGTGKSEVANVLTASGLCYGCARSMHGAKQIESILHT